MSIDPEIGSRHLLGTDGLAEQPNAMHQCVRIVITQDWANSVSGQLIAECLVNLLARQVGLVEELEIVSAAVPLLIHPIIKGVWQTLTEYLVAVGEWAVGMKVRTGDNSSPHEADHTIVIGGATTLDSAKTIACIADSWKAWVGELKNVPDDRPSPSLNPVGPFFAAALAAGEIFKRTWGLRRGRFLDNHAYSLWKNSMSSVWEELDAGPALNELHLPPFVLVGAGAVGNALVYVLTHLENRDMYPVLVDDDVYDKTNLNRCSLAGTEDLNQEKTAVLASRLEAVGIASFPFSGDLKRFVNDARAGMRADVAEEIGAGSYSMVVSCVDKGDCRQDIQGLHPQWLLGGSTFDLQAKTNVYAGEKDAVCLGCHNAREHQGEAMRGIERQLRAMSHQERASFLTEHGLEVAIVEEYINDSHCGHLGRAALMDFVSTPPPEFSVGFVSLGSGVLLAASLFRNLLSGETIPHASGMTTFNFLNGNLGEGSLARDPQCQICSKAAEYQDSISEL
jgi:hypothetical protein